MAGTHGTHQPLNVYAGLYTMAPGPESARACFDAGGGAALGPGRLTGVDARVRYQLNRTPAGEAHRVIAATSDPAFLGEVALLERRPALARAALVHPCGALDVLIAACDGKARSGLPRIEQEAAVFGGAARRFASAHGLDAAVTVLLDASPGTRMRASAAVAALPGLLDDEVQLRRILYHGGVNYGRAVGLKARAATTVTPSALRILIAEGQLEDVVLLATERGLDELGDELVEAVYERAARDQAKAEQEIGSNIYVLPAMHLYRWLAERPQRDERYTELATGGTPSVLAALAENPSVSTGLIATWTVAANWAAGLLAGRVLAARFGDDAQAFEVAGSLLPRFTGTYGQLADTVAAVVC